MDSQTHVVNDALTLLGDAAVTSITEDSDRARVFNAMYTPTLDQALRSHDWNFARLRVSLVELADKPAFGYNHMFQLPQDPLCLRVLTTNLADDEAWEIETYRTVSGSSQYRVILTDAISISIRYIARILDTTLWDGLFADAFVHELARRAAYAITAHQAQIDRLEALAKEKWRLARSVDGQESRPLQRFASSSFTRVR